MDDLISRQDALKALDEMSYKSPHESATSVVRKKHFEEILEKFIMQQPSAQQWIPCSERLPEDDETVIVTRDNDIIAIATFEEGEVNNGWWMDFWYTEDNVKAWMPLPELYREETES